MSCDFCDKPCLNKHCSYSEMDVFNIKQVISQIDTKLESNCNHAQFDFLLALKEELAHVLQGTEYRGPPETVEVPFLGNDYKTRKRSKDE